MHDRVCPPKRMRFSFESRCRLVSMIAEGTSPRVAAAGEHERRDRDLGQAVGRVVVDEGVEVALQVHCLLLVREAV